jgi:hypothetical protein
MWGLAGVRGEGGEVCVCAYVWDETRFGFLGIQGVVQALETHKSRNQITWDDGWRMPNDDPMQ